MPSAMLLAGGMNMEKNVKLQIALLLIYSFQKLLFRYTYFCFLIGSNFIFSSFCF